MGNYVTYANQDNEKRKLPLFNLIVISPLASVGAILPSPALEAISDHYATPAHRAEWVVTIFVLGYALSQLIYCLVAHAFGRKKHCMLVLVYP
ncbi:hypothetical protein [Vibrio marisflavi]|uniref:Major facilitator superfamily (MFS) profile domain-containing protein n=1 Tax=Vibrio marisflavi CECT 7928 TaxID=634439 RepID=A0ABM9A235_9VIBR|nr:hypothetical protein [Vibrio marisflavi]CAH0538554.1 hypothetical protein VMF7928_01476 [Vibrio marisflavi CECT 7928]